MALVQYGGGVLDMRGSIGGQVHSKNRNGSYVRARTTPVNPNTDRQSGIRASIATLVNSWTTELTQVMRDAWEVYAANIVRHNKLGAQIKLTGFNMFIRCNAGREQDGLAIIADAPIVMALGNQDPTVVATVDEAAQQISVAFDEALFWSKTDLGLMFVQMSLPHAASRNFIGGPYRMADVLEGDTATPLTSPQVMAVPFPVGEGQQVKCAFRISEADGRLSDQWFHQSLVTA